MNQAQQDRRRTQPELIGYALLEELGVSFEPQFMVDGKFCVDAYLPDAKIAVQFDGDYWHGHPSRFTSLDARQQKRVNLDRSQDAYMHKHGLKVLRFWESDLKRDLPAVRARLSTALLAVPQKSDPADRRPSIQ